MMNWSALVERSCMPQNRLPAEVNNSAQNTDPNPLVTLRRQIRRQIQIQTVLGRRGRYLLRNIRSTLGLNNISYISGRIYRRNRINRNRHVTRSFRSAAGFLTRLWNSQQSRSGFQIIFEDMGRRAPNQMLVTRNNQNTQRNNLERNGAEPDEAECTQEPACAERSAKANQNNGEKAVDKAETKCKDKGKNEHSESTLDTNVQSSEEKCRPTTSTKATPRRQTALGFPSHHQPNSASSNSKISQSPSLLISGSDDEHGRPIFQEPLNRRSNNIRNQRPRLGVIQRQAEQTSNSASLPTVTQQQPSSRNTMPVNGNNSLRAQEVQGDQRVNINATTSNVLHENQSRPESGRSQHVVQQIRNIPSQSQQNVQNRQLTGGSFSQPLTHAQQNVRQDQPNPIQAQSGHRSSVTARQPTITANLLSAGQRQNVPQIAAGIPRIRHDPRILDVEYGPNDTYHISERHEDQADIVVAEQPRIATSVPSMQQMRNLPGPQMVRGQQAPVVHNVAASSQNQRVSQSFNGYDLLLENIFPRRQTNPSLITRKDFLFFKDAGLLLKRCEMCLLFMDARVYHPSGTCTERVQADISVVGRMEIYCHKCQQNFDIESQHSCSRYCTDDEDSDEYV